MLHTKADGKGSIVVDSLSLGTTPRKVDLGVWRSELCVKSYVVFWLLLIFSTEFDIGDDFSGLRQLIAEKHLDAQAALLYQMEARSVARVGSQVETEEGAAVTEVGATHTILFALQQLTG